MVPNEADKNKCVCCENPKPGAAPEKKTASSRLVLLYARPTFRISYTLYLHRRLCPGFKKKHVRNKSYATTILFLMG